MNLNTVRNSGFVLVLLAIGGLPVLTGCSLSAKANQNGVIVNGSGLKLSFSSDSSNEVKETLDQNQKADGIKSIRVSDDNGNITIEATDDVKEVEISATKTVSGDKKVSELRPCIKEVHSTVSKEGDVLVIKGEADYKKFPEGVSGVVNYVLKVPKNLFADLRGANGEILISGMRRGAKIRTSNGKIEVKNVAGTFDIETSNGEILADNLKASGKLRVHSNNGQITVKRVSSSGSKLPVEIVTTNSEISFSGDVSEATLSSGNGEVSFEPTDKLALGDVSLHTSNAAINLKLPAKVSAKLTAQTSNGHIDAGAFNPVALEEDSKSLSLTLGSGAGNIHVETNNGSITVEKQETNSESSDASPDTENDTPTDSSE